MSETLRQRLMPSERDSFPISAFCKVVLLYDLILIIASVVILISSQNEDPAKPLRKVIVFGIVLLFLQLCVCCIGICSSDRPGVKVAYFTALLGVAAFVWWIVGITSLLGGDQVHAPHLFWLTATLLALPFIVLAVIACCVGCIAAIDRFC